MFTKTKKSLVTFLTVIIAVLLFLVGALMLTPQQTAYAYNSTNMPTGDKVINLDDDASTKFSEAGLNQLAEAAGYANLNAMMSAATTAGTSLTDSFTDKVVRLGKDTTTGGSELKWVPVYLSRSEEDKNGDGTKDAILTLWLANDVYKSTYSDGTYSTDIAGQSWDNDTKTIYSNTYDGSFIRHKLNGKTGWTTSWETGSSQANANDNIRTLMSNFYGSGTFASCVTTPANVSWQANENYMKNDPAWNNTSNSEGTGVNYPSAWVNDNVWLPSMYEVCDSTIAANSVATSFTANGGLWQVNKGNICSVNNSYSWLRSGYPTSYHTSYSLYSDGGYGNNVYNTGGVRPALHLNLESAAEAIKPATCEFPSDWKSTVTDYTTLTEITFAKTAPEGYTDSGDTLNTNIKIYTKNGDDTKIAFVCDGTITAPTSCYSLFYNLQNLTAINFDNFSTDNVTNMSAMFQSCSKLTSLDLSGFNTAKVTNMSSMFSVCSGLQGTFGINGTGIKISNTFTTDNVTIMSSMFYGCGGLTSLDLSGFNTASVTSMSNMFQSCSKLTSLDLSGFNTASVTSMSNMFNSCSKLTSLDLSGFNTASVTYMSSMFYNCTGLQGTFGIDGTAIKISDTFKTDNVTSMSSMFNSCSKLTSLDLSGFNTAKVTNMISMFSGCSGLQGTFGIDGTAIKISDTFTTANVTNMSSMFNSCSKLTSLDLSGFNTAKVTSMNNMFYNCSGLTLLDLSGFNTANVTNMGFMFNSCSSLKTITVSDSLATKLSETTDDTYFYYGVRATWYDGNGGTYTNTNRFSTAGTYTTVQPPFEVTVGSNKTYYNTLPTAWNYANGATQAATVKMLGDAEISETLTVNSGKNITLDLNGHKLEYTGDSGSVIRVLGTFTLNDTGKTATNTITSPVTNQSVTIKGGVITGGKGYGSSVIGGGVFVDEDGSFTMNGGTLAGNTADYGGGVRVGTNATFIMNSGATISHNKATKDGGGICVCSATKVELKGTVSDNAAVAGGGIYYEGNGTHIISGATIKNNTVTTDSNVSYSGYGGGIYVDACAVTMSSGSISGNSATISGGGVYVDGSTFEMTNGTIIGNTAKNEFSYGCGMRVASGGTFKVSGGVVIKDNVMRGTLDDSTGLYTGGTKNNVYLANAKITVAGALTTGAIIGVYNSGDIATGFTQTTGKASDFFIPDNSANNCVYVSNANDGMVSIGAHTGGKATCVAAKVCTNCGDSYGEVDSTNHDPATAWSVDAENGKHYHVCNNGCGNRLNEGTHTPEADDHNCITPTKCSVCQTVITEVPYASHDFSGNYETSSTQHWHVCTHSGCNITDTKTEHNYNQENANNAYLKSAATCTAKAVYYKSCICGQQGTETFESGNPLAHDFTNSTKYKSDGTQHWKICKDCTAEDTEHKTDCSGGTANCVDLAECEICGNAHGAVNSSNHKTVVTDQAQAATCTSKGKTEGSHCSACNTVIVAQEDINALGHDYSDEWGWSVGMAKLTLTCKREGCNHKLTKFDISATGVQTKAPTCTEKGETTYTATYTTTAADNSATQKTFTGTKTVADINMIAHTPAEAVRENVVAATCSTAGSYDEVIYCSVCSAVISRTAKTVEKIAHTYGDWQTTQEPTCSAVGSKKKTCGVCGDVVTDTIAIDENAHSYGEWIAEVAANCTDTGTKAHKDCSLCHNHFDSDGVEITDLTIATNDNHAWNGGEVTTGPTCTDEGVKTFTCTRNPAHTKTESVAAKGHTWHDDAEHINPTCTTEGSSVGICIVCDKHVTQPIPALGHDKVQHEAMAATCTAIGWNAYETCSRCDYTTKVEIPATGHTEVTDNAIEATCTTAGKTEGKHCSVCDTVITAQTEVAALGHDYGEWTVSKAANCTEKGEETRVCAHNNAHKETRETVANGHSFGEWIAEIPATATDNGTKGHKDCSVCNKHFDTDGNEITDLDISATGVAVTQVTVTVTDGAIDGATGNSVTVNVNGEVTVVAANVEGKIFKGWSADGGATILSANSRYTFTATENLNLVAVYEINAPAAENSEGLSGGAIAGISIGAVLIALIVAYIVCYFVLYRKGKLLKGKMWNAIFTPMNAIFKKKENG